MRTFSVITEFVVLLLGGLLLALAMDGRVRIPQHPLALDVLAFVLLYWSARSWIGRKPRELRVATQIRAVSLFMLGVLVLGIGVWPRRITPLLAACGILLMARGLAGSVLELRGGIH